MKAAYGRQTPAPDHEPTCVEPGSPMGELMRRYWQPVCTFDELHEVPRKEKLLCEAIVVFRDRKRRVGALDPHCAHRGTSLEWGRVEEEGLRCRYHGWLYDTEGQCTDMPCATEEFRKAMDVWQPAYPATEYGGLVFVYIGPLDTVVPALRHHLRGAAARARRSRSAGGRRPIAIHALENLAHSDTGIVMLRRLLCEQLKRVEQGLDPINTMRDPSANKRIPTGAWNKILSPAEAAALPYREDL